MQEFNIFDLTIWFYMLTCQLPRSRILHSSQNVRNLMFEPTTRPNEIETLAVDRLKSALLFKVCLLHLCASNLSTTTPQIPRTNSQTCRNLPNVEKCWKMLGSFGEVGRPLWRGKRLTENNKKATEPLVSQNGRFGACCVACWRFAFWVGVLFGRF